MLRPIRLQAVVPLLALALVACGGDKKAAYQPRTRTYFIAADEVAWDFAPANVNRITGEAFAPDNLFINGTLGKVYRKSLYREYTDATFTTLKPVPAAWQHLGTLGPLIRGVVGDTIVVEFKNNTAFPSSVHPHNVLYLKDSEGAPYVDGTTGQSSDDAVPPTGTHLYTWQVPERAGPGPEDGSSILSMYHSHVNETRDTNAGLIGPMIITRAENARDDGTPDEVDRELVNLFTVFDENASMQIDANIAASPACTATPSLCDGSDPAAAPDFEEGNLKHTINGFLFGNFPEGSLTVAKGQRVRWYLMGMGTEVDLHTPHWHGQTVLVGGMRMDVTSLLPATMVVADMVPDNAGTWLYHCHVNDHIDAGMITTFTVE